MTPDPQTPPPAKEQALASEVGPALSVTQKGNSTPGKTGLSLAALSARLRLQLDLCVPLPSFCVQNLLSLEKGQVIESAWPHTEDLPLWSGGVHLVWTEFEVVDQKLAVRVTRLV